MNDYQRRKDGRGVLKIDLYPTQRRFVESQAPIIFLVSSQGEGKTFVSFVAHIYHFYRLRQKVRGLFVRDTHTNIKNMTVPSIEEAIAIIGKGSKDNAEFVRHFKWHDDYHLLTHPILDLNFTGMDNVNDVNKLMGAGYSIITLEEPAPMMSGASQGIPESAFIAGVARSARQGGITTSRLQITMNKADEFHWTTKRMYVDPIMRPEYAPDIYTEVIEIPFGENETLSDHARQAARAAYELDPSLKARFIDNKVAFTVIGEPVTKFYDENVHRSKEKIDPLPNVTGYRLWDQGHNPSPYSQDTEILTENGWKPIKDADVGDMAVTLNPCTKEIEYRPIVDKIKRIHTGKMYHWKGRNYDLRCTDDHAMPYMWKSGIIRLDRRADNSFKRVSMPKAGEWRGKDAGCFILPAYKSEGRYFKTAPPLVFDMDAFCGFMGIYLSEGSTTASRKKATDEKPTHYNTTIWQKDRNVEIENLLYRTPLNWHWTGEGWAVDSVQLHAYLKKFGNCYVKYVPREIKNAPFENIKTFIKFYMIGDGTGERRISTSSKRMADDLQELALKAHMRATIHESQNLGRITGMDVQTKNPHYIVDIGKADTLSMGRNKLTIEAVVDEPVYCVMVEKNHIIYVRRNGKPQWGGNCVVLQVNPLLGRLVVLDTFVGDGIGMKQLIKGVVKPAMQTRYAKVKEWVDSGDPAIRTRDQSDTDNSPLSVIENELDTIFEPGVSDWQTRKELINMALTESPMLLLSRHEMELHLGLRGGWAMKKLSTGQVLDIPPKGRFSHPCDALSQGLAVLIKSRKPKKEPVSVSSLIARSMGGVLSKMGGLGRW